MKEKILNFFGLTTLKEQEEIVNYLVKRQEELVNEHNTKLAENDAKLLEYKKLFDWDFYEKTLIEWNDWRNKNNIDKKSSWSDNLFNKYYNETRKLQYQAYKIRTISQYPEFLSAFLLELSNYDFKKDVEFFKEIGFKYPGVEAMTVEALIDTVITLLPKNFDDTNNEINGWASGGYEVCFYYENTEDDLKPKCKIKFDKRLFYN